MDMDKLVHLPRNVRELISTANEAWIAWDNRPPRKEMAALNDSYYEWESDFRDKMNNLGATLMLFGILGEGNTK